MFKDYNAGALLREFRKNWVDQGKCHIFLQRPGAADYHDRKGVTALMAAVEADLSGFVELLVERGASLSATDKQGRTPLHYAAFAGNPEDSTRYLCKHGADINAPEAKKATPLHLAVRYANLPAARLLVVLGADTQARDANGDTPLKLAERLSRGPTFTEALTKPVTEEERNPPRLFDPRWDTIPMPPPPPLPSAARPLSVKELGEMKKALKASFRRATAPGAGTDALTLALTAQALLTVDARLRDCAKGPGA